MPDRMWANVPRLVELEPGFACSELAAGTDGLTISSDAQGPLGVYEPLSARWLGRPTAPASTDTVEDWESDSGATLVSMSLPEAGAAGIMVTDEGDWDLRRVAELDVNRGLYLDLWCYEPPASVGAGPLVLRWGAADANGQPHWQLTLQPSEAGPGFAALEEWDGAQYVDRLACQLLAGQFYNALHRLWLQPLDDETLLLRNRDDATVGAVVRSLWPVVWHPDRGSGGDEAPADARAVWGPGQLEARAGFRAWFVVRPLTYAGYTVETTEPRSLGYPSTQDVTTDLSWWIPDGRYPLTSGYNAELEVFADDLDGPPWSAGSVGTANYAWRLTVDNGDGLRSVTVDRASLAWQRTLSDDGAERVDLCELAGVQVEQITEQRGRRDTDARLTVRVHGPLATLRPYYKPGQRWQWEIDLSNGVGEPDPYIRFDGLRDTAEPQIYHAIDGTYMVRVTVNLRSRWRQADQVLFRGQIDLDGKTRSQCYAALAQLIPLDSAEVVVDSLDGDLPIPKAKRGQKPLWEPQIGTSIGDLLRGLRDSVGPLDRLLFLATDGVNPVLRADTPSQVPAATLYRSKAAAEAADVPAQVIVDEPVITQDDSESYNEFILIGSAPPDAIPDAGSGGDPGAAKQIGNVIRAYYADPRSWTDATYAYYLGARRTIVLVDPSLNTQYAVQERLLGIVRQFGRFRAAGRISSFLVPTLYPEDVVTIDPGSEPGAVAVNLQISGMTTTSRGTGLADPCRYATTYELAEVLR